MFFWGLEEVLGRLRGGGGLKMVEHLMLNWSCAPG